MKHPEDPEHTDPSDQPGHPDHAEGIEQALAHVAAERAVADVVRAAAAPVGLQLLRTGPARAELGADHAKEFALLLSRSHVDLAVAPDVARDHAQQYGFVRQRSNGRTTVIRVAASQLGAADKRAAFDDLVVLSVEHRATCPDRIEPRVARSVTPTRRPSSAAGPRTASGPVRRTPAAAVPPPAPLNLCPVHGTEMLGGVCDRCD